MIGGQENEACGIQMIVVHHLVNSRSQRILWLLEELEIPYSIKHYHRLDTMAAPEELKAIHPLGKSPLIEDGDVIIAETGAIVEYLVECSGGRLGPPKDRDGMLKYRYFLHYAEGSILPALLGATPDSADILARPHLDFVDGELATRPWFAGADFTAADIMMYLPLQFAASTWGSLGRWQNIDTWLEKIRSRERFNAAENNGANVER